MCKPTEVLLEERQVTDVVPRRGHIELASACDSPRAPSVTGVLLEAAIVSTEFLKLLDASTACR